MPSASCRKYTNWVPSGDQRGCLAAMGSFVRMWKSEPSTRIVAICGVDRSWMVKAIVVPSGERSGVAVPSNPGSVVTTEPSIPTIVKVGADLSPGGIAGSVSSLPRFKATEANRAIAATITAATAKAPSLRFRARRRCASSWRASAPEAG